MMTKTIRQIIEEEMGSDDPQSPEYEKRDPTRLNQRHIESIYGRIMENYGNNAAESYCRMLAQVGELTPARFLETLYSLVGNNWKVESKIFGGHRGIYTDEMVRSFLTRKGVACRDPPSEKKNGLIRRKNDGNNN